MPIAIDPEKRFTFTAASDMKLPENRRIVWNCRPLRHGEQLEAYRRAHLSDKLEYVLPRALYGPTAGTALYDASGGVVPFVPDPDHGGAAAAWLDRLPLSIKIEVLTEILRVSSMSEQEVEKSEPVLDD